MVKLLQGGIICLASALPLVADEACMDDRFGWCHEANATSSWLLFPFEDSYGRVQRDQRRHDFSLLTATRSLPQLYSEDEASSCALPSENETRTLQRRRQRRTRNHNESLAHPPTILPESAHDASTLDDDAVPAPSREPDVESSASSQQPPKVTSTTSTTKHDEDEVHKVDYASKSVGAILLESSHGFSGTSNLLQKDKDKYAIVACQDVPVEVTIGLSEDILVKQIQIANYERYSGSMRNLHLYSSSTNTASWTDLGIYELSSQLQTLLELRAPVWARYLKLEFLDYYGSEYYCTVSQISVYGSTMLQGFHEQWDNEEVTEPEVVVEPVVTAVPDVVEPVANEEIVTDDSSNEVNCGDIDSIDCFEQLVLKATRYENRSVAEHMCFSSLMISRAPGSKEQPIQPVAAKQQVPLSTHTLAELELPQKIESPPVDEARLRVLSELLQRFPSAKCLEHLTQLPKLKSSASSGHAASHDGGLEPIFAKFSAEIKALQSDVLMWSEYSKVSSSCYQTLLLELVLEQQKAQYDFAERLEKLEQSVNSSWYSQIRSLVTTNVSVAMNSVHGKRLGAILGLTSSVWNDASFCGIVCILLLAIFLYLGGSRYQGRITIRRRSLLESTEVTDAATEDVKSDVVSSDETVTEDRHKHKKRRKRRFGVALLK